MLLAVVAVIIGLGTLSTGVLREAVLAVNAIEIEGTPPCRTPGREDTSTSSESDAETAAPLCESRPHVQVRRDDPSTQKNEATYRLKLEFDPQWILLYGLFFTALLAVVFTPSYVALRRAGQSLRDRSFKLPAPIHDSFDDVIKKRNAFDEYLQTKLSAIASIKAGIAILSPLAGSLAALVLELPE